MLDNRLPCIQSAVRWVHHRFIPSIVPRVVLFRYGSFMVVIHDKLRQIQLSDFSQTERWQYSCPFISAGLFTKDMVEVGWMVLVTVQN